jgi:hypothetical protein
MRLRTFVAGLALAGSAFLAPAAQATTLAVTELSFGSDLANSGPGSSVGTLDIGVNTISGSTSNTDPDYFAVTLLAGQVITQVSVSWSIDGTFPFARPPQVVQETAGSYDTGIGPTGSFLPISSDTKTFAASFSTPGAVLANIRAGRFDLVCTVRSGCIDGPSVFPSGTYTFTYTVAAADTGNPVPEPATLTLLGTGVLAVALRRRLRA